MLCTMGRKEHRRTEAGYCVDLTESRSGDDGGNNIRIDQQNLDSGCPACAL